MKCYDSLARAVGRNYALKRSEKFEPTTEGGSVVSRHRISKPARSGSSSALHVIFASGVAPPSARFAGVAGEPGAWRRHSRCENYMRSEEHTSELQSLRHLVCRLLLEKKKSTNIHGSKQHA